MPISVLTLLKMLNPSILVLMATAVFFRNWKFHDRRRNFDQGLTRGIVIAWLILAGGNAYVVWSQWQHSVRLQAHFSRGGR